MAFSIKDIKKTEAKIPITCLYGPPGIGKTTFATEMPRPVFLQCEQGQGGLSFDAFPVMETYDDVISALSTLYEEEHDYKTVVIDTISDLEMKIWSAVCDAGGKSAITDFDFGKGYGAAVTYWQEFWSGITALRDHRGILVLMLAHSEIERQDSPDTDTYDRYQPQLHKNAFGMLWKNADIIAFANTKPVIKKTKEGFKESRRAIDVEGRMMNLTMKPAHVAKNRYKLPDQIPLVIGNTWNELSSAILADAPSLELF